MKHPYMERLQVMKPAHRFLIVLLLLLAWILKDAVQLKLSDWVILSGNVVMLILALFRLVKAWKRAWFSFSIVHWTYVLFFFGIAPIIHTVADKKDWCITKSAEETAIANIILLIWCFCYCIGEELVAGRQSLSTVPDPEEKADNSQFLDPFILRASLIFAIVFAVVNMMFTGIPNPLSRDYLIITGGMSQFSTVGQILYKGHVGSLVLATAIHLNNRSKLFYVLFPALLFFCSPLNMSRYMVAVVYIGLATFWYYSYRKREGMMFSWLLYGGLIVAFPIMDFLRIRSIYTDYNLLTYALHIFENLSYQFSIEHYDGWSMMAHAVRYVHYHGLTWGTQLLGSLLFWIPRSIWEAKPVGSGAMINAELFAGQVNPSCPLPVEGYINIGLVGTILFAILFSLSTSYLDISYHHIRTQKSQSLWQISYPFLIVFFFFQMRGDMMSSFAYCVGFFAPALLIWLAYLVFKKPVRTSMSLPRVNIYVRFLVTHIRKTWLWTIVSMIVTTLICIGVLFCANHMDQRLVADSSRDRDFYEAEIDKKYADWQLVKENYDAHDQTMNAEQKEKIEDDLFVADTLYQYSKMHLMEYDNLIWESQEVSKSNICKTLVLWGGYGLILGAFCVGFFAVSCKRSFR